MIICSFPFIALSTPFCYGLRLFMQNIQSSELKLKENGLKPENEFGDWTVYSSGLDPVQRRLKPAATLEFMRPSLVFLD